MGKNSTSAFVQMKPMMAGGLTSALTDCWPIIGCSSCCTSSKNQRRSQQILDLHRLGPIMPVKLTENQAQINFGNSNEMCKIYRNIHQS
jgi:hypothetical protein